MKRIFVASVLALALTACSQPTQQQSESSLTKVTFVADWKAEAEHGGFYQALAEGLYAKAGLDVKIVQGGPSVNVAEMVGGGAADFGIGSNAFIPMNLVRENI